MTLEQLAKSVSEDYNSQYERNNKKVQLYESTGLLQGMQGNEKIAMAVLLDNQFRRLLKESTTQTNLGGATFVTGQGEQHASIVLPMVRKVFVDTISAKEMVSIQPISVPSGIVFYLDMKYGSTKSPFTQGDSVYGTLDTFDKVPSGGMYGAGRYGYSVNQISGTGTASVSNATFADVMFDSSLEASVTANEIKKVTIPLTAIPNYDIYAVTSFYATGGGVTPANTFPQFTSADLTNIYFFVTGSTAGITGGATTISYTKQNKDNDRGDYEDRTGSLTIADFEPSFKSVPITAKSRKLKGSFTPEASKDIFEYQGINLEAELTSMMSESIGKDIDLETFAMLLKGVNSREYWSAQNNTAINAGKTGFAPLASAYYNDQKGWFNTLGTKINQLSNKILQKTVRGAMNFAVISPTVANVVESMSGYNSDADVDKTTSTFGANRAGSFNGQVKVFKNPLYLENRILGGFKGNNYLETGAVLAPYVGLETTPLMYNPNTGTPTKIVSTRYGKLLLRGEFYGDVVVTGLNTL